MAEFNIDKIVQSVKISVDNQLEKALAAIVRNELGETEYIVNAKLIAEAIKEYKKPKRRIDTMTEYELSDLLYRYIEAKSRSCRECPVHGYCYVHPPVGCTRTVVRYLLSPAEEEKK